MHHLTASQCCPVGCDADCVRKGLITRMGIIEVNVWLIREAL